MAGPIFDSHAHYTDAAFDPDRDELLSGLPGQGVTGIVTCATHSKDAAEAVKLSEQYPFIWAAVGIHPESLTDETAPTVYQYKGDWQAELEDLKPLFGHPRVAAVGECGLDHHWPIPEEAQLALLRAQLKLSADCGKPIILHDREAHAEMYSLLREFRPRGVLHCYSGSADDAKWLVEQGIYLGFGGSCTFKGAKRAVKALQEVPLDHILLETDCPYLSPVPLRGTRNNSANIQYVARFIAETKGITEEEVYTVTEQNAKTLFHIL